MSTPKDVKEDAMFIQQGKLEQLVTDKYIGDMDKLIHLISLVPIYKEKSIVELLRGLISGEVSAEDIPLALRQKLINERIELMQKIRGSSNNVKLEKEQITELQPFNPDILKDYPHYYVYSALAKFIGETASILLGKEIKAKFTANTSEGYLAYTWKGADSIVWNLRGMNRRVEQLSQYLRGDLALHESEAKELIAGLLLGISHEASHIPEGESAVTHNVNFKQKITCLLEKLLLPENSQKIMDIIDGLKNPQADFIPLGEFTKAMGEKISPSLNVASSLNEMQRQMPDPMSEEGVEFENEQYRKILEEKREQAAAMGGQGEAASSLSVASIIAEAQKDTQEGRNRSFEEVREIASQLYFETELPEKLWQIFVSLPNYYRYHLILLMLENGMDEKVTNIIRSNIKSVEARYRKMRQDIKDSQFEWLLRSLELREVKTIEETIEGANKLLSKSNEYSSEPGFVYTHAQRLNPIVDRVLIVTRIMDSIHEGILFASNGYSYHVSGLDVTDIISGQDIIIYPGTDNTFGVGVYSSQIPLLYYSGGQGLQLPLDTIVVFKIPVDQKSKLHLTQNREHTYFNAHSSERAVVLKGISIRKLTLTELEEMDAMATEDIIKSGKGVYMVEAEEAEFDENYQERSEYKEFIRENNFIKTIRQTRTQDVLKEIITQIIEAYGDTIPSRVTDAINQATKRLGIIALTSVGSSTLGRIIEVEPIEQSRNVIVKIKSDLKRLVEEPLLEASKILYDKNIQTLSTSANKKDTPTGNGYIIVDHGSLSNENKSIAREFGQIIEYDGKSAVKILIPLNEQTTIQEVSKRAVEIANSFKKQKMTWVPIYTLDQLRKAYYSPEATVEDFKEEYYYDVNNQLFYLSKEHYDKVVDSETKVGSSTIEKPGGIDLTPGNAIDIRGQSLSSPLIINNIPFNIHNFQGFTFQIIKFNRNQSLDDIVDIYPVREQYSNGVPPEKELSYLP